MTNSPDRREPSRAKKKKTNKSPQAGRKHAAPGVRVRRASTDAGAWEFVHPRCARDRAEDMEEVRKMIAADEIDVAIDELRWLLSGCSDFIEAHKTLGELALLDGDLSLARGHFGYAFELGTKGLDAARCRGPLPYRLAANQAFHEAGKGLAYCLRELGESDLARRVVKRLAQCDPSDPLGVQKLMGET